VSQAAKVRLEDLDIKPYVITKLKMTGIQSVFDLAISIPHQLVDVGDDILRRIYVCKIYNTSHLEVTLRIIQSSQKKRYSMLL
jgi:hypothetical protein